MSKTHVPRYVFADGAMRTACGRRITENPWPPHMTPTVRPDSVVEHDPSCGSCQHVLACAAERRLLRG